MKRIYNLLLINFILCFSAYSQQYNFNHYSIEHGLAQSQVYAFLEDSRGYLWIGTDGGGVSMFDGITFINYTTENGLIDNQIRAIYEDSEGNMWFGTKEGYVTKFNGKKFINYTSTYGLENNTVLSIAEGLSQTKSGQVRNIFIGTEQGGLYELKNNKFQKVYLPVQSFIPTGIIGIKKDTINLTISALLLCSSGKLWIGTQKNGVIIKDKSKYKNLTTRNGLCNNNINSITEDNEGNIWFATRYGASKYDGEKFTNYYQSDGLSGNHIKSIINDKSGNLWFGCYGYGACRFDGKEFVYFDENNGLASDFIMSVLQDKSGNIWFSTDGGGICKFNGERFKHLTEKDGVPGNVVMSILEDKNKNLWFGTYGNGICRYDGKSFKYFTKSNGLCSDIIYSIIEDSKGNLWFGSKGNGVSKFIPEISEVPTGSSISYKIINYNTQDGLSSDLVYSIIEDRYGNIWFGTLGGGISIFDGNSFTNITRNEGLHSNLIYAVFEDNEGNIWLGTDDAGVDMIFEKCSSNDIIRDKKISENNIINITRGFGLSNNQILSILQDRDSNIWFGTFGGGICKFDGKEIKSYSVRDGLNSNNIYLMLYDSDDFLWAGTEKGINKIDLKHDIPVIKTYGISEGFRGIETNFNAAIEDSKGYLWFGNIKGVTQYNPVWDIPNVSEPQTHISNIKLFFEQIDWAKFSDTLYNWTSLPVELNLPYNKNHLTFEFNGIDLKAPEKVTYQWILEGFDKKWSPVTSKREVTYSYIPYGKYTFKVKACNNDGIWNKKPVSFHFIISPPFWFTWWFYLITALILITLLFIFIKLRERNLEKEKRILEEKVKIRTVLLREEKATVQQQAEEIRAQAEHLAEINKELEKLSIVASETDNAVIIANQYGYLEWVNEGFTNLFGYTLDEFKKIKGKTIVEASSYPNIKSILKKCFDKKQSVVYASQTTNKKGENIWVQTTITPILDEQGNVKQFIAIDSDITKIKSAEEEVIVHRDQLKKAFDQLQELEKFKDAMSGMIVHDLKNHLNSIIAFSSQVLSEKNLKNIHQSGKQMLNMVLNILDVQKFEDTKVQLDTNIHNVKFVVQNSLNDVAILIKDKGIKVENKIKPIYQSKYDYNIILRVMINLLTNAIKYTPAGGKITINAEPFTDKNQEFIKVSLSDTGTGIPKNMLDRIFDKFLQVEAKESGGASSTGLGLTFCKMVIDAHKGNIWAESELDKGTTFHFTIPKAIDKVVKEVKKEGIIEKEKAYKLTKSDIKIIEPFLIAFKKSDIYEISKNLALLENIKKLNGSPSMNKWIEDMETAIYNFNENVYNELISVCS